MEGNVEKVNYLPPIAKIEKKYKIGKSDKIKHHSRGRTEGEKNQSLGIKMYWNRTLLKTSRPITEIDHLGNRQEKRIGD